MRRDEIVSDRQVEKRNHFSYSGAPLTPNKRQPQADCLHTKVCFA